MRIFSILLFLLWSSLPLQASTDPQTITVGTPLSPPFKLMFEKLLYEAALPFEMLEVPLSRERKLFVDGVVQMECCVNPAWRDRQDELAVQMFSDPVYVERHLLVSLANTEPELTIENAIVAVIRGFDTKHHSAFKGTLIGNDYTALFGFLLKGRADLVLVGEPEYQRQVAQYGDKFKVLSVYQEVPLHIRVHNSREDILPALNRAIERLQETKDIQRMIEVRVRPRITNQVETQSTN